MALGRALVVASVVALLFPLGDGERPVLWAVLGIVLGSLFVGVGVLLLKEEPKIGVVLKRRSRG